MPTLTVTATVTDAAGHTSSASAAAVIGFVTERAFRESLDLDTYDATETNTGCYEDPAYPVITRTTVSSLAAVAGQVYENLNITGQITPPVGAGRAVLRNCWLKGPAGSGHLLKAYDTGRIGVDLIDCTLWPQVPDNSRCGAIGRNFTLTRCKVSHLVDGVRVQDTNDPDGPSGVSVRASWFGDHYWEADAADGTHCEPIQISSGAGTVVTGNTLQGFIAPEYRPNFYGTKHANTCIMIKPDVGLISGLDIRNNRIEGGAFAVNVANKTSTPARTLGSIGTISDNRFGRDQRQTRCISLPTSAAATVTTGNVYADNGSPAPVVRQG